MACMTLNDIIVAALAQLDRGHDAQTLDVWRDKLTGFANDALMDLAYAVKPKRRETVRLAGGCFHTESLARGCLRVLAVEKEGRTLFFREEGESGRVRVRGCGGEDEAEVLYRCLPKPLSAATDEPELPAPCHPLIVTYAVARERSSADPASQRGANVYYQLYDAGRQRLRAHLGGEESFRITNRW